MSKSTRAVVFYWLAVIASSLGMYAAYLYLQSNSNQLSLAIGLLGAAAGFFASQASNVKNQTALERILGASLIREKEIEAKTVEEAKALYEKELANLKEIIEREGNHRERRKSSREKEICFYSSAFAPCISTTYVKNYGRWNR